MRFRNRWGRRACVAALVTAPLFIQARPATAQNKFEGFALDRFDPSVPVDAFFGVPSPAIGGHLEPRAALSFDYGLRPFVFDKTATESIPIVAAQGYLRLAASLALWDRLLVSLDAPAAVLNSGQDPQVTGVDFHPPSKPAVGDLRVGLRGRFWGDFRDPFQIGAGAYLYTPTGSRDAYTGEGRVRGNFHLLLGGRAGTGVGFVWSASAGATVRAGESALVTFGGGAGLVIGEDRLQIGPEVYGTAQIGGSPRTVPGNTMITVTEGKELEILGGIKVRLVSSLFAGVAAGTGPLASVGSPPFRFIGSIAWTPLPPAGPTRAPTVGDRDGDGIRDDVDACPDEPGELQSDPTKDGCPIPDKDKDGVLDVDDACPTEAGVKNPDPTKNGCPPDGDEDGIPDTADACPKVPGVKSADPKKNGCPSDRDGDGVADNVDACPDAPGPASKDPKQNGCPDDPDGDGIRGSADACPLEKGPPDPDPKKNGCPRHVRVDTGEITISTQIEFQVYGKSRNETITPVSEAVLKEIKDAIEQHPEVLKLEVQGHTDDSGSEEFNQTLSQERADRVRQWLIDAGVPASKLVAKGYGYTKPRGDNRIKTGRMQNRRVQFVILERKK
jgi:outer membrane protein OmpA-like peptidoglycan-associated protein